MTKRERVVAALGGQPVDRPPVAFWRHAPDVDHTAKGLAEAMLSFHRRFGPHPVKGMSCGGASPAGSGGRVAGADGLFVATQTATREALAAEALARFELPYTRRLVEAVAGRATLTLLHIHGREIAFDELAALPVHAINWHDRLTPPTLGAARRRFAGAAVGGLSEWETLRRGPVRAIADEVDDAVRQTGGRGVIVAPGCVLPLDVPEAHLDAVVDAVKRSRP